MHFNLTINNYIRKMKTTPLSSIISILEKLAPPHYQESYDNAGLIVGNNSLEITGAVICLDSTEEVIEEAIKSKCNLVIAHHPIIFSGLKKLNGKNYIERAIIKAIKNDIAIYAIHTNLDNVREGVNKKIADKIGLMNCKILAPLKNKLRQLVTFVPHDNASKLRQSLFKVGGGAISNYDECSFNISGIGTFRGNENSNPVIGRKGSQERVDETRIEIIFPAHIQELLIETLKQNHPYEEVAYYIYDLSNSWDFHGAGMVGELSTPLLEKDFLLLVKNKMRASSIRHTKFLKRKIKTVTICGGAGFFLLPEAIKVGADVFVTSDVKYHQFFDADKKILLCDIGHYESEQFTIDLLHEYLNKNLPTFALRKSKTVTNPVNYF